MPSLTTQALTGAFWTLSQRGGQQVIRFVVTVILARLLLPEHFGLVAMLEVFIAVSERFIYAGFGGALIQKKVVSQTDLSTLFWYNLAVATACYFVLFLAAPGLAEFFREPELAAILRVAALGLICMGFQVVQGVRFTRRMDFKVPTFASLGAVTVSAVTGISLALNGFGVWSLVYAGLARRVTAVAVLWIASGWTPSLAFSRSSMQKIVGFGGPLLLSSLLGALFTNIHTLVIGRVFSVADLGFFNRGRAVQQIASDTATQPVLSVLFPVFSRIHDDRERMAAAYLRVLQVVAFLVFPALFLIAATSEPLVLLIYTDKWSASIPYLRLLALTGVWLPIALVVLNVTKALGQSVVLLRLNTVRHLFAVAAIALTYRYGIEAIITGLGVAHVLFLGVVMAELPKRLPVSFSQQVTRIGGPLLVSTAAFLFCSWLRTSIQLSLLAQLGLIVTAFHLVYLPTAFALKFAACGDLLTVSRPAWNKWPLARSACTRLEAWVS